MGYYKNYNKHNNNRSKWVDINAIYNSLHAAISRRVAAQERQRVLWSLIRRDRRDRNDEMRDIDEEIGEATHKINGLISQLCCYRNKHKTMNLAYFYLAKEIERIDSIIENQRNRANKVRRGEKQWIYATGECSSDPTLMDDYIQKKINQRNKLQNWQNYVSRYLVR